MAFRTFDRKVYIKMETTEGEYNAPSPSSGYIETTDPTWSVTNRTFERNPTRGSITPVQALVAGTASNAPSATVEISFSVELAGSGTAATAPRWGQLLEACGMVEVPGTLRSVAIDTAARAAGGPAAFRNYENISFGDGVVYATGERAGRVIGDTFYDDGTVYYISDGATVPIIAEKNLTGQASVTYAETLAVSAISGVAWVLTSGTELGGSDNTSLTIALVLDSTGAALEVVGCRGNVEFAFTSGDRVLMNFTFQGRLYRYDDDRVYTPTTEGGPIPAAFVGVDLTIQDSSYGTTPVGAYGGTIFSNATINLGNEITVRENVDVASGYDVAYITGRTPTMTWNPDAVTEDSYDYWTRFLVGETSRIKMTVGSTSGNQFLFKMPAAQFTGIADGSRDEVVVYDSTTTLTGGDYGSSVQEITGADSTVTNERLGTNNEFMFIQI